MRNIRGFTLIEILVVMGILLFVGTIIGGVFFASLRNSNKANSISIARDNGNYAMSQMVKTIQFAQSFNSVSNASGTFNSCTSTNGSPSTAYSSLNVTNFNGTQIQYTCGATSMDETDTNNGVTSTIHLTNPSLTTTQNPDGSSSCSFTCTQSSTAVPPVITIQFTLSYTPPNRSTLVENSATIPFKTTVSPRNY